MQVSVEKSGDIECKLTVTVPSVKVDQEIKKRLQDVAKKVRIAGFRPGKAPLGVVRKHYASQVAQEVINDTINSSYVDALSQEKIVPAGLLRIEPKPYKEEEDLEYVALVELYPEIPVPTLDGRVIEQIQVEIADDDIERTINEIRKKSATYEESEKSSEEGNLITIDFVGKIDGETFSGGSGEDFKFLLGQGEMLPEFDKGLHDVKKGDKKEVKVKFPEGYGGESISGKQAVFAIDVKKVEIAVLPEVDDNFAKLLGVKEGGIEAMKKEITQNLERERKNRVHALMRERVMGALYDLNDISVPTGLINNEAERMEADFAEQQKTLPPEQQQQIDKTKFYDEAQRRVRMGLIGRAVIEKFNIEVDEEAVRQRITEMSGSYEDPESVVSWYYAEPERLSEIRALLIEERVLDSLLTGAQLSFKKSSFQDLVQMNVGA